MPGLITETSIAVNKKKAQPVLIESGCADYLQLSGNFILR
jgi:hypothetical protein